MHHSLILIPLVVKSTKKYIDCVFCQCDKIVVTLAEVGCISAVKNIYFKGLYGHFRLMVLIFKQYWNLTLLNSNPLVTS